jgi:HAD superfamily hydrolase (TIGR01509 family)
VTARLDFATTLFDVDGTLIDSNGTHADTWTEALREHGIAIDAVSIRPLIGMGGDKLLLAAANIDEASELGRSITRRKKELFAQRLRNLHPTHGARSLVQFLLQLNVGLVIATSADDREMNDLLKRAGVDDLIPRRTSKDDAEESKPDPDIVQGAMKRLHARPQTTIMIGDTPYDIEAALRAGIRTIALRCGGYWSDADLVGAVDIFDDPAAFLEHLRHRRQQQPDSPIHAED